MTVNADYREEIDKGKIWGISL